MVEDPYVTEHPKHTCTLPSRGRRDPFSNLKINILKKLLLKAVIVSEWHPLQKQYLRSTTAVDFEKRRHIMSGRWYVIHPFSLFTAVWQMLLWVLSACVIINMPWCHKPVLIFLLGKEGVMIIKFMCLANICVLFFTGYVDEESMVIVLTPKMLIEKYLSSYFYIDILGACPLLCLWYMYLRDPMFTDVNIRMNCVAVLNLFQARIFFLYAKRTLGLFKMSEYTIYAIRVSLLIFLIIHLFSCLISYVPYACHGTSIVFNNRSWLHSPPTHGKETPISTVMLNYTVSIEDGRKVYNYKNNTEKDPLRFYVICVCRTICIIFTMGYGRLRLKTREDMYLTIIYMLVGKLVLFYIMEKFLKFRGWTKNPSVKYYMLMNQVDQYVVRKQLPPSLQRKVRLFYEYRFDKRFFEEKAILANLSKNLRSEIQAHECRRLVQESELFRYAPSHVVERILTRLKHDVYLPNDVLIRAGTYGDCMFFLLSGTVAVLSRSGDEMLHLRDGAFFGELALLAVDERRVATIIAIEVCEVYRLDKEDFQLVVRPQREVFAHIHDAAERRLSNLLGVEAMYRRLHGSQATSAGGAAAQKQ